MKQDKLNYLIESNVDKYIDNIVLQEVKLSSLKPTTIMSYADDVISNSFKTMLQGLQTILKGGIIGGAVGILINGIKSVFEVGDKIKATEGTRRIISFFKEKFTGEKLPNIDTTIREKISMYLKTLSDRLSGEGSSIVIGGIFVGLTLGLIYAIFIKNYNMKDKDAKNKIKSMVKKSSMKADKESKKIIDISLREFDKNF